MKQLIVIAMNHFDQAWRRRGDAGFVHGGRRFASYRELQAFYIEDCLALARKYPGFRFVVETVAVLRDYFEGHPEREAEIRALWKDGRVTMPAAGDNIVDANMLLGETLARNFINGAFWMKKTLDYSPRMAARNDAFGNSAQLPQILRGCGYRWVTGMSYNEAKGVYWRGLDGSTVATQLPPMLARAGTWKKFAPCSVCKGFGGDCPHCAGRGVEPMPPRDMPDKSAVSKEKFGDWEKAYVFLDGEENLPGEEIIEWAQNAPEGVEIRFGGFEDLYAAVADTVEGVDHPDESRVHPSPELNPNNTGCYASRIEGKTRARRQEYALLQTESLYALKGARDRKIDSLLQSAWRDLLFTLSHDGVTGEHVDPAADEIRGRSERLDNTLAAVRAALLPEQDGVSIVNLTPDTRPELACVRLQQPAAFNLETLEHKIEDGEHVYTLRVDERAPYAAIPLTILPAQAEAEGETYVFDDSSNAGSTAGVLQVTRRATVDNAAVDMDAFEIENEFFRVSADKNGATAVFDKRLGREISRAGALRPFEWIYEHDEGSPWATLTDNRERVNLAACTRVTKIEKCPGFQRVTYHVECPLHLSFGTAGFDIAYTLTLYKGIDRVQIHADAWTDDYNHRLRLALPLCGRGRALYEIPYGTIERGSYEPSFHWSGANGDWPCVNWAGVECEGFSAALLNKGTPSYTVEDTQDGALLLVTPLRSPSIPTYLHEPTVYSMTEFDGMRDAGAHKFDFALASYTEAFADSAVVEDADSFVQGLTVAPGGVSLEAMPEIQSDCARVSAVKRSEDGDDLIVRLYEYRGKGGTIRVRGARRVDLLEAGDETVDGEFAARPFEIVTLRFPRS